MSIHKTLFIFLLFILNLTVSVSPISAHIEGQPPFFKVNDEYAPIYPVPLKSTSDKLELPQDIAPKNYVVGETLNFEIDRQQLPFPPEILDQLAYAWQFGDGQTGTGITNTHKYQKPGSYLLTVDAQYPDSPVQRFQAMLINILPNADYQMPHPRIMVDGQTSTDPILDILRIKVGQPIPISASESTASSAITEYTWDLGDGTSSSDRELTHAFPSDFKLGFVVLRIKDSTGLIQDTFVQVSDAELYNLPSPTYPQTSAPPPSRRWLYVLVPLTVILAMAAVVLRNR